MKISLINRSLYYKGLMLLIRKDHEIHDRERKIMMRIGEALGFESQFCLSTIEEILDNKYVTDSPPLFSDPKISLCFIRDGLKLSASDGQPHKAEIAWLKSVAEVNGLGALWAGEFERFSAQELADESQLSLDLMQFEWA